MSRNIPAKRVRNSSAYRSADRRSRALLDQPARLKGVLDRAIGKLGRSRLAHSELADSLRRSVRLIRAYSSGAYRDIPLKTVVMILATIVYFVMPLDLIPDILLGFGFADDLALLGWTLKTAGQEVDRFAVWEQQQASVQPPIDESP